jgi:hypothetical protein
LIHSLFSFGCDCVCGLSSGGGEFLPNHVIIISGTPTQGKIMTGTSIRKIVTIVQETRTEIGQKIDPPTRQCAAIAVIANPYAGRYLQELP